MQILQRQRIRGKFLSFPGADVGWKRHIFTVIGMQIFVYAWGREVIYQRKLHGCGMEPQTADEPFELVGKLNSEGDQTIAHLPHIQRASSHFE